MLSLLLSVAPATAQTGAVPPTLLIIDMPQSSDLAAFKSSDRAAMTEVTLLRETELNVFEKISLSKLNQEAGEKWGDTADDHGDLVTTLATRYAGNARVLAIPGFDLFDQIFFYTLMALSELGLNDLPIQEINSFLRSDKFTEYFQTLSTFFKEQNIRVVSLSVLFHNLYNLLIEEYQKNLDPTDREKLRLVLRVHKKLWQAWTQFTKEEENTIFVHSAGNDSKKLVQATSTANVRAGMIYLPNVLYVGALNSGNGLELYSNYGTHVVQIGANGTYDAEKLGASFAAPRVSGTLAKIFSEKPEFTVHEGVHELLNHHTQQHPDLFGLVQGARALKDPEANMPTSVPIPSTPERQKAKNLEIFFRHLIATNRTDRIESEAKALVPHWMTFYLQRGPDGKPTIRMDIDCRDIAEGN